MGHNGANCAQTLGSAFASHSLDAQALDKTGSNKLDPETLTQILMGEGV